MKKVSLEYGLYLAEAENGYVTSDGLERTEYIHYVRGKGLCYEDGALIGMDHFEAFRVLDNMDWTHNHNFYYKLDLTDFELEVDVKKEESKEKKK